MNIVGVDEVVFGVEDMEACSRFWNDFGLERHESEDTVFATPEGALVRLLPLDDERLPLSPVTGPTMREMIWGVEQASDLDSIAAELARDREVRTEPDGTIHTHDSQGYGIGFRVSAVERIGAEPTPYNAPGAYNRIDVRGAVYERAQPHHLAHVVFRYTDLAAVQAFYVDRLGFRLTDYYPDRGYFLRAAKSSDHHNLFAFNPDGTEGFHHVAFECRDIHEVFGGGLHMTSRGWETHIGPGRHPISSSYFWYFKNPCGGAAEYDFDSDVCGENWEPRAFEPTPESFAEWALDSGIEPYGGIQTAQA